MKLSPPSPRDYLPSRAHPEHRKHRKQLEKEHPFGFKEFAVLGLIGLTLAWDIEKQVEKREQRKDKERERKEGGEDETRRRSSRSRRDEKDEDGDRRTERRARSTTTTGVSDRSRRNTDCSPSRDHRRPRQRSVVVDRHADRRYEYEDGGDTDDNRYRYRDHDDDRRYRDESARGHRRYDSRYDDLEDLDRAERGRQRRDSW